MGDHFVQGVTIHTNPTELEYSRIDQELYRDIIIIIIIIIIINTDLQHMHVYMLMSIGVCDIRCVMC